MSVKTYSVAILIASAGYAPAAFGADEKPVHLLLAEPPASAWLSPPRLVPAPPPPLRSTPTLAGFIPSLSWSLLSPSDGSSRLLFLSPLSPLRAALRLAAQDLATQTRAAFEPPAGGSTDAASDDVTISADQASRRRDVVLRQRRKSVLNEKEKTAERSIVAGASESSYDVAGLSGNLELRAMPTGPQTATIGTAGSLPGGSGVVHVSGSITDDLTFAVTGLAAESAATTFRAGAEFELQAGDNHRFEVGAIYGTRFQTTNGVLKEELDRRSVGAFRVVHAMNVFDNVSTRVGGRYIDAPFLKSSRAFDPEVSILIEGPADHTDAKEDGRGRTYLRLDLSGDTLFPGLDVVNGTSDMIALSEGLPVFAADLRSQQTWNRGIATGYRGRKARFEARLQDQTVAHALLVFPSSLSGAPLVENGQRPRVQIGTLLFERTFASGQAQAGIEYGYGRFASNNAGASRASDFHQITTRFDAMLRRTGTGIAVFHRFHQGAGRAGRASPGPGLAPTSAQRYLIELRQDVPFVPSMLGADMALLVSLRNVYYDDVDRRNVDEFSVAAPPRRITGGIRVKF